MLIALLADIHANLEALEAVLVDAKQRGVCEFICAGDLVDYGPNPNEVVQLVRENNFHTVMGNHDQGVGFEIPPEKFIVARGRNLADELSALRWTQENTLAAHKEFLRSLPRTISLERAGRSILVTHGLPNSINAYVDPGNAEVLKDLHDNLGADIFILGHLHLPYRDITTGSLFVNPGSVGKPKDGDPKASYAILKLDNKAAVEFHRVPYSIKSAAEKIDVSGLPKAFSGALFAGR